MKNGKRICAFIIALLMTSTLFIGCGNSTSGTDSTKVTDDKTTQPRNESLYFNGQQWGSINDWNPLSSNSNNAMGVTQKDSSRTIVYETLYMYNMLDGKIYPLLAKGQPAWNNERTVLTVKLNPDAKWSDGTQVTADDVVYTFDTNVKYESAGGLDYKNYIDSMKASDKTTVVINAKLDSTGKAVNPLKVLEYLPKQFVMQKAYIQKVESRNGNDATKMKTDKMEDLVGSGPYKPYVINDQKVVLRETTNIGARHLQCGASFQFQSI